MRNLIKKYRKFFVFGSFLVLLTVFISLYFIVKVNFHEAVKISLKNYAKINVDFDDIQILGLNKLSFKNLTLKDKENKTLLISDDVEIVFTLKELIFSKNKKADIIVKNAVLNFEMYKGYKNNFINAFKREKKKKSGNRILNQIILKDSQLDFRDFSKEKVIYKRLKKFNGKIRFGDGEIELGARGELSGEKYNLLLKKKKDLYIKLEIKDVRITDRIMQYAFADKRIEYKGGKASLDLELKNKELKIKGKINEGNISYIDLSKRLEKINGIFSYEKGEANVDLKALIDNESLDFNLKYKDKETEIKIKVDDFYYAWAKNYKLLKSMDLDLEGKFEKAEILFKIKNTGEFNLDLKTSSERVLFMKYLLNDIKLDFTITNNKISLKRADFYVEEEYLKAKVILDAQIEGSRISGNLVLEETEFYIEEKELTGKYKIDLEKKDVSLNLKSLNNSYDIKYKIKEKYLDLLIRFGDSTKITYKDTSSYVKGVLGLNYDLSKKYLKSAYSDMTMFGFYDTEKIKIKLKAKDNSIDFEKIYISDKNDYMYSDGNLDLENFSYRFNIRQSQINIKSILEKIGIKNDYNIKSYVSGIFQGEKKKYELNLNINSETGKFILEYRNLKGNIYLKKDEDLTLNSKLVFKSLNYSDFELKDVNLDFELKNSSLKIIRFGNTFLKTKGTYNILNSELDIKFSLKDYYLKQMNFKKEELSFFVKDFEGVVKGDLDNPKLNIKIKDLSLNYNKNKFILNGNLKYENYVLKADKLKIDSNIINGKIDFLKKELDLKLNILENNYKKLYNVEKYSNKIVDKTNFRILGEINLWGGFDNFKSSGKVNFDTVFYDGQKYPNLTLRFSYNKGDVNNLLNSGVLNFTKIELFNDLKENILSSNGSFDLKNKKVNVILKDKIIDVSRLSLLEKERVKGLVKLDAKINGELSNLKYSANISSNKLEMFDYKIEEIDMSLKGDSKGFVLNRLKMIYNENPITAKGTLQLSPFDYDIQVKAQEIDLGGLNFLFKEQIKNLSGKARLDVLLSKEESRGLIAFDSIAFTDINENLNFENINSRIDLENNGLYLRYLNGKINQGLVELSGIINFENDGSEKRFFPNSWEFNYNLENLNYRLGKYLNIVIDSKGKLTDKNLKGDLIVKKGELRGFEVSDKKNDFLNRINIEMNLELRKEFKIAFENISVIQEIESRIEGNGTLKVENGKVNFLGTVSTDKGVITVNNNDFEIESGVMVFEDPFQYLPNLNPSIALTAATNIAGEEISVRILGDLKNPQAELDSRAKGSNGEKLSDTEIVTLLAFHNKMDISDTEGSDILEELLARQLKTQIFNPISSKLEKFLKIPKIDLSPTISIKDATEENANSVIEFGGKLELAEIPFFNDYLFLNFAMEFLETEDKNSVYKYDAKLDYRFRENSSLFLEANRTQEEENSDDNTDELELRIGFQFTRKFNFFEDLIKE